MAGLIYAAHPLGLPDEVTDNGSVATSELIGSLAGRTNWLVDHARGYASALMNPQGTLGLDHSGPPYGVAFLHTVAGWQGLSEAEYNTNVVGGFVDIARAEGVNTGTLSISRPAVGLGVVMQASRQIWVKPFPPTPDTPYSKLRLDMTIRPSVSRAFTITTRINGTPEQVQTTSTLNANQNNNVVGTLRNVQPGFNDVEIVVAATSGNEIHEVVSWALNQIMAVTHA